MAESEPVEPAALCTFIVHELSNPLSGMLMSIELMESYLDAKTGRVDNTVVDLLENLKRETNRLNLLLETLRSSRPLFDVEIQATSLVTEARELLVLQSAYYRDRGIRVEQEIPSDLPLILADKTEAQASSFKLM